MPGPKRKIFKRVAVAAATVVAVLTIIAVGIEVYFIQSLQLHSRTVQNRQFKSDAQSYEMSFQTIRQFEERHAIDPEKNDGLRIYIDEWPAWKYLISFQSMKDGSLKGAISANPYEGKGPYYERGFVIPEWQAHVFLSSFDRQIDGFWGAYGGCTDGTLYQYERWQNKKVLSGIGNAACQMHYAELKALVGETLVTELRDAPFDWRSWFDEKRFLMLEGKGS